MDMRPRNAGTTMPLYYTYSSAVESQAAKADANEIIMLVSPVKPIFTILIRQKSRPRQMLMPTTDLFGKCGVSHMPMLVSALPMNFARTYKMRFVGLYIYIYTRYILHIIVTPELLYKQRQLPMSDLWTALLCSPMKPGLTAFTFILRLTLHPQ